MAKYRLITLDVDHNNEINDAWSTSDILELSDEPTKQEVCQALKNVDRMAHDWPENEIVLEEDGDDYFVCNKKGRKVYQLRLEP